MVFICVVRIGACRWLWQTNNFEGKKLKERAMMSNDNNYNITKIFNYCKNDKFWEIATLNVTKLVI